eukprot:scaffold26672_cov140-Skeletonema_menzelii.AAC.7
MPGMQFALAADETPPETESDWVAHFCGGHNTISSFVWYVGSYSLRKSLTKERARGGERPPRSMKQACHSFEHHESPAAIPGFKFKALGPASP